MLGLRVKSKRAFTIVELLIVIVTIGILSGIIFATYTGINRKAITATVKSDLSNGVVVLKLHNADYGIYPITLDVDNCPAVPNPDTRYCLRHSAGNTISYTGVNQTFALTVTNTSTGISYQVNELGDVTMVSSILSPLTPSVAVALDGNNVQAIINPISCPSGVPQYGIRNRINDGSWSNYSAWSTDLTSSQTANEDTMYIYQAQARCYTDASTYSSPIESTEAAFAKPLAAPEAPVVTSNDADTNTTWSWPTVICAIGTASYRYDYTISPSGYDSDWTSNGTDNSASFTTTMSGQTYVVTVQAKCNGAYSNGEWSTSGSDSYTTVPSSPAAPAVAVALNGANIQATITPVTCTIGTPQYGLRNRINNGAWGGYSAWSTNLTAIQAASDGVKYGYQTQARCYVDAGMYSTASVGVEGTYIKSIAAPAAPTVSANTVSTTTTWSWPAVSCTAGSASYQYRYTISPSGYDSGWVSNGTNLFFAATTSVGGQTYTINAQAMCVGTFTSSGWGSSGSAGYFNNVISYTTVGMYTWTIPAGVNSIQMECWGGDSNSARNGHPVNAGYAKGTIAVTNGQVLNIYVAGAGGAVGGGWNGGAIASHDPTPIDYVGGGASDIRLNGTNLTDRIIVAGGAGGGADRGGYGGVGGGLVGGDGYSVVAGRAGKGGTQLAGGIKGNGTYGLKDQQPGVLGLGGHSNTSGASGGGGGGYYGGGGGSGTMADDGGGGGGSSYIGGLSDAITTSGVSAGNGGNGKIIITILN